MSFKTGFRMDFRLGLVHVGELPVDRPAVFIGADRGVAGQTDETVRQFPLKIDGFIVAAVFRPAPAAGFQRRGEGIKTGIGPIQHQAFETGL